MRSIVMGEAEADDKADSCNYGFDSLEYLEMFWLLCYDSISIYISTVMG